ncbi:hypothetical protein [Defluviimonas salinarum]|uniref:Uncharacterized protein n=1 Tax=Defluviimonas salinarum TaxID=2992147 RepID=A0ABT3J9T2_9RHOB|nr:hypothetical protein [Defluviimonas salinarum]MCW3784447.1 hypothetical protein [Defluviimonas salinarum]
MSGPTPTPMDRLLGRLQELLAPSAGLPADADAMSSFTVSQSFTLTLSEGLRLMCRTEYEDFWFGGAWTSADLTAKGRDPVRPTVIPELWFPEDFEGREVNAYAHSCCILLDPAFGETRGMEIDDTALARHLRFGETTPFEGLSPRDREGYGQSAAYLAYLSGQSGKGPVPDLDRMRILTDHGDVYDGRGRLRSVRTPLHGKDAHDLFDRLGEEGLRNLFETGVLVIGRGVPGPKGPGHEGRVDRALARLADPERPRSAGFGVEVEVDYSPEAFASVAEAMALKPFEPAPRTLSDGVNLSAALLREEMRVREAARPEARP